MKALPWRESKNQSAMNFASDPNVNLCHPVLFPSLIFTPNFLFTDDYFKWELCMWGSSIDDDDEICYNHEGLFVMITWWECVHLIGSLTHFSSFNSVADTFVYAVELLNLWKLAFNNHEVDIQRLKLDEDWCPSFFQNSKLNEWSCWTFAHFLF